MAAEKKIELMPMVALVALVTVVFSGVAGFWAGFSLRTLFNNKEKESCGSHLTSLEIEDRLHEAENNRSPASDAFNSEYYLVLEKNHLEDKDRKLLVGFSPSETGHNLAKLLTLLDFSPGDNSPEGHLKSEIVRQLQSQPTEVLGEVRHALNKLGPAFQAERENLIQFVGSLDLSPTEKADFFSEQMLTDNPRLGSKLSRLHTAVTLLAFIQTGADSSVIEPVLRQVLERQTGYGTRTLLLGIYESRFPEDARRLKLDFGV